MTTGFDAHVHLDAYDEPHEVWERARSAGISGALIPSGDPEHHPRLVKTAESLGLPYAIGVHPWWAREGVPVTGHPRAIGEIGLDRLRPGFDDLQVRVFRDWLARARDLDLPVVLHCVRAASEMLGVLRRDGLPRRGGMVHAWREGPVLTAQFLELGLHLSFGSALKHPRICATAASVPRDRLLLETDGPDPHGIEPADLPHLAAPLAHALELEATDLLHCTGDNARRLFA